MKNELKELFEARLNKKGLSMSKELSCGFWGSTYDERKVYNTKDLGNLINEGFSISEDAGIWMLNLIYTLQP